MMQKEKDISCSDIDRQCSDPDETISREFNRQIDLKCDDVDDDDDDCDQNEEENDDFTFMLVGGGEQVLEDDQIRPVFPLFDQKLLFDDAHYHYEVEEIDRLPIQPPVDKIFIQSPRGFPLPTEENHTGPYCAWSKQSPTTTATATATATAELISKKSNSTGFSKLWRLKEKGGRSNSYGRDAFVFLKSSDNKKTTATTASSSSKPTTVEGGKARVVKAKRAKVSAHEAYLKSRGGHTEEERRRSYLPYRPQLMGFFTNVHAGLTKNVHPY